MKRINEKKKKIDIIELYPSPSHCNHWSKKKKEWFVQGCMLWYCNVPATATTATAIVTPTRISASTSTTVASALLGLSLSAQPPPQLPIGPTPNQCHFLLPARSSTTCPSTTMFLLSPRFAEIFTATPTGHCHYCSMPRYLLVKMFSLGPLLGQQASKEEWSQYDNQGTRERERRGLHWCVSAYGPGKKGLTAIRTEKQFSK